MFPYELKVCEQPRAAGRPTGHGYRGVWKAVRVIPFAQSYKTVTVRARSFPCGKPLTFVEGKDIQIIGIGTGILF